LRVLALEDGADKLTLELNLAFNRLTSIKPVLDFCSVTVVNICGNELSSLNGIETLRHLQTIDCSRNKLVSLGPLGYCPVIKHVWASNNKIVQVSDVLKATPLQTLVLYGNPCDADAHKLCSSLQSAASRCTITILSDQGEVEHLATPVGTLEALNMNARASVTRPDALSSNQNISGSRGLDQVSQVTIPLQPGPVTERRSQDCISSRRRAKPHHASTECHRESNDRPPGPTKEAKTCLGACTISVEPGSPIELDTPLLNAALDKEHDLLPSHPHTEVNPSESVLPTSNACDVGTEAPRTTGVDINEEVHRRKYSKSSIEAILIRKNGSCLVRWPNGTIAISIEPTNSAESKFRTLAMSENGKVLASFDDLGSGTLNYENGRTFLSVANSGQGVIMSKEGQVMEVFNRERPPTASTSSEPKNRWILECDCGLSFTVEWSEETNNSTPSLLLTTYFKCKGLSYRFQNGANFIKWCATPDPEQEGTIQLSTSENREEELCAGAKPVQTRASKPVKSLASISADLDSIEILSKYRDRKVKSKFPRRPRGGGSKTLANRNYRLWA